MSKPLEPWEINVLKDIQDGKSENGKTLWGGNPKITVVSLCGKEEDEVVKATTWRSTVFLPGDCPYSRELHALNYDYKRLSGWHAPCLDCPHHSFVMSHTFVKHTDVTFLALPNQTYLWRPNQYFVYRITVYDTTETFHLIDKQVNSWRNDAVLVDSNGVDLKEYVERTLGRKCFRSDVDPILLRLGAELVAQKEGFCGAGNLCKLVFKTTWSQYSKDFQARVLKDHPVFAKLWTQFLVTINPDTGEMSDYD